MIMLFFYGKEDCFVCQWFILEWLMSNNDYSHKQLKYEDKKWCWFDYGWSIAFISIYHFYDLEVLLYIEYFTDQNEKRMPEENKNQSPKPRKRGCQKDEKTAIHPVCFQGFSIHWKPLFFHNYFAFLPFTQNCHFSLF